MSKWHPIETAPRDGTTILGARQIHGGAWEHYVVWWDGGWCADDGYGAERPQPTHWTPIPEHQE